MSDEVPPGYAQLKRIGAPCFITRGPDSGGLRGLFCHRGHVIWFVSDSRGGRTTAGPMAYEDFVDKYAGSKERGYREALDHIHSRAC
jgi:hypothetical protein